MKLRIHIHFVFKITILSKHRRPLVVLLPPAAVGLPCLQHRLLAVDEHVHAVDEGGVGPVPVHHGKGVHQSCQRAVGGVRCLAALLHDAHLAGGFLFRALRDGGEEGGFARFQVREPCFEEDACQFAVADGFQVLQEVVQDAAFLRLGEGGRVAVFVEERLELRGGAAKGFRGVGGHGLEVVVGRAPGIVAGGVSFGGEGGGGNGGGVFQGVVEGVDRVFEGGDGGGQHVRRRCGCVRG